MQFYSITFIFCFLPIVLLVSYFLSNAKGVYRDCWLLIASLLFYAFGNLNGLPYLIAVILVTYASVTWISTGRAFGTTIFVLCIFFLVGILFLYKWVQPNALPIGISFYTFQAISYLVDSRRGQLQGHRTLLSFALYLSFFPQLIAGPIVRYNHVEQRLEHHVSERFESLAEQMTQGCTIFILGLSKKVLLADQFAASITTWSKQPDSLLLSWMHAFAYTLQIYFDFSGYSDMAIGLGRMFGFFLPKNFDAPYISTSMTEFWRRWHITLGSWFRDYVYIPLGGSKNPKHNRLNTVRNLLIVFLLTGLWHGIGLPFLCWGLAYGILIALERLFGKPHGLWGHVYVLFFTVILFVLFESQTLPLAYARYRTMFGLMQVPIWNDLSLFFFKDSAILFLLGILFSGCFSFPRLRPIYHKCSSLLTVLLFFLCLATLINGTSSPFLYFQF